MSTTGFMLGLARTTVEASVLILLVLATQWIFRRRLTRAWSCALWLLVAARLAAVSWSAPVSVFRLLPSWPATAETFVLGQPPVRPSAPPAPFADSIVDSAGGLPLGGPAIPALHEPLRETVGPQWAAPARVLFWLWAAGTLGLLAYVGVSSIRLARRLARLPALDDPRVREILADGCARLHLRRLPRVSESHEVGAPTLHGFFRPRLLLPPGFAARLSAEELRFVLLHELAHVRRADLAFNWLATALQAVHWFNPLVWLAFARWRDDREIACDALVLATGDAACPRAYGHTLLRLVEMLNPPAARPSLVGILEGKRALRRRIALIAEPTIARGPLVGTVVFATLAAVGLTGAQPPAALAPLAPVSGLELAQITGGRNVLFLVDASESMLGKTPEEVARWRVESPEHKRSAPKWQRTAETLATLVATLPPEARYRVVRFDDHASELSLPAPDVRSDPREIAALARRLQEMAPHSAGSNLEAALVAGLSPADAPDRIVLITDRLPTAGRTATPGGADSAATFFEAAVRHLPPRVPVSVILLPQSAADPETAGRYWTLAHATRGVLATASTAPLPATHIAFVVDTSGSMRDIRDGGLRPVARQTILDLMAAQPAGTQFQLLDADGRFILGRSGAGAAAWFENTSELRERTDRTLGRYNQDTVSNPIPGIYNAIRFLYTKDDPAMRMAIFVVGDEFVETPEPVLRRLGEINPADASGRRAIGIHAIGIPSTIRTQYAMGSTGMKFAYLMRSVTDAHGGTFIALPDL